MVTTLEDSVKTIFGSGGAVAAIAYGAYSAVGLFGTASTGAAISALSGVAATNATLAWFGGGSLAAGGLGVAGGTLALGGLALVPAAAIGTWIHASKMKEQKENAHEYFRFISSAVSLLQEIMQGWEKKTEQCKEAITALRKLDTRLKYCLDTLEKTFKIQGVHVDNWTRDKQDIHLEMIQVVEKNIEDNQSLWDDEVSQNIDKHYKEYNDLVNAINQKWGQQGN